MNYSNSKLVIYTNISPNKTSPRNHVIDTITIHCMAGNLSVETCGNLFAKTSRQASSNYGIGSDGRIAMYAEEKDRSWCTSSKSNDHRAVTIEVANDGGAPDWHVSAQAMSALIELAADICKRNGKKRLIWFGDKNKTLAYQPKADEMVMTVHRWFAAKACPGNYLYGKHGYIAEQVNQKLSGVSTTTSTSDSHPQTLTYTYKNIDYSLVFDPVYYGNAYPDLKRAFGSDGARLFHHFCNYGMKEGRIARPSFNINRYKVYYADLRNAFGDNLPLYYEHYVKYGHKENRKCV